MIPIRLLNGEVLYINSDLVESVAAMPDTIITLTSGRRIVASSPPDEIIDAVVTFRHRLLRGPTEGHGPAAGARGAAAAATTATALS